MSAKLKDEYEKDFYAWTLHNAELMRKGKLSEIDVENIAEETMICFLKNNVHFMFCTLKIFP